MQGSARPIETVFQGYKFRSRLEARWAVYFDALRLPYEYEMEGYDLGEVGWYLPDFWLPLVNMWAEVKPVAFTEIERRKCRELAKATGRVCLLLTGPPALRSYWGLGPFEPGEFGQEDWGDDCDYVLSNYHDYPRDEHRFYCSTGYGEEGCWKAVEGFEDYILPAIDASRQARFGEKVRPRGGYALR